MSLAPKCISGPGQSYEYRNCLLLCLATFPWDLLCTLLCVPGLTSPCCPGTSILPISSCPFSEKDRVSRIQVHSLTSLSALLIYYLFRRDFPDPSIETNPLFLPVHPSSLLCPTLYRITYHRVTSAMFYLCICICLSH